MLLFLLKFYKFIDKSVNTMYNYNNFYEYFPFVKEFTLRNQVPYSESFVGSFFIVPLLKYFVECVDFRYKLSPVEIADFLLSQRGFCVYIILFYL